MASVTAPVDGRPQFSFMGLAVANAVYGRQSLADVQQIGPDRYILPNAWPTPAPTRVSGPAVAAAGRSGVDRQPGARQ